MWTLVIAMATSRWAQPGFVANIARVQAPTVTQRASIALVILLLGTAVTSSGGRR